MPAEKNTLARILVPIAVIALAVVVVVAVGINSTRQAGTGAASPAATPAQKAPSTSPPVDQTAGTDQSPPEDEPPAPTAAPDEGEDQTITPAPVAGAQTDAAAQGKPAEPAATATEQAEPAPPAELMGLGARRVPQTPSFAPLGSLDPASDWLLELRFAGAGAGVESITLARYYTDTKKTEHYAVQRKRSIASGGSTPVAVVSLAARAVIINGETVDLYSTLGGPIWRETAPGAFEAVIEDSAGAPIARVEKRYVLTPNSYNVRIEQRLVNLTDAALKVEWIQYGPVDMPPDLLGYGGDQRRLRFGYLLSPQQDPSRQIVETERSIHRRRSMISKPLDQYGRIWPTDRATSEGLELVWTAMTNRYFAFVAHPTIDPALVASGAPIDKVFHLAQRIDRVLVGGATPKDSALVLQLRSGERDIAPNKSLDLGFSAYTGPKWRKTLARSPVYAALGMRKLVVFNFGGPCAFCTFQPLARGLLYFLGFFHDYIFHDWGLAIMFLVVCVRSVLHPVTKKSQISVQRFSKQMQALAPKQKKIQEKYKDDPKKLREEMSRLMREDGVNFTGALGCLPMFLQSPVWIALYAMLFFAFDLRHHAAFFGVFQALSGGSWTFLSDLSAPDRFISVSGGFSVPLMGRITSINVLPLLLGIVFYIHQKYMQPPPSASATPEQKSQQKIMKVMMVLLFPVMMYNAPSGLALYFITNSTLGIFESRYIRAHIKKLDLEPPKTKAPARKRVENMRARSFGRHAPPSEPKYKQRKK